MQGTLFMPHLSSSSPEARCFLSRPPCYALLFPGTKQNKNSFWLLKCIEWLSAFQPFCAFSAKTTCRFEFEVNLLLFLLNAVYYFAIFFSFFLFVFFMHRVSGTAGGHGILCSQTALFLLAQYRAKTYWSAHRLSREGAECGSASSQADWVCHQESRDPW